MWAAWRLSKSLASLRTAEALCRGHAEAQHFHRACAIAQLQLMSHSSHLNQTLASDAGHFARGFRTSTAFQAAAEPGSKRSLEFVVTSGMQLCHRLAGCLQQSVLT